MAALSPIRYQGGKSRAASAIADLVPMGTVRMASPFAGGCSVEIACARRGIEVAAYDVFTLLAAYWRAQLGDPIGLARRLSEWEPTQACYGEAGIRLRRHWEGEEPIDDPLELAAHFWLVHNLSYGPGFPGWLSSVYRDDPPRYARMVERVRNFRAQGLSVGLADFRESIPAHRDDLLYCDPPYVLGPGGAFKGIYPGRNDPRHHLGFDHEALRGLLLAHRGGFILSYNDSPLVREWYSGFRIVETGWQWSMGQGETRDGRNRRGRGHVKESSELLIIGERRRSGTP